MIKSMTGYGKAEAILENGKLTIEIRTLNSKNADINIKSSLLPKDKELQLRNRIADSLQRGTIDVFINWEPNAAENAKQINLDIVRNYLNQINPLFTDGSLAPNFNTDKTASAIIFSAMMKLPDIVDSKKQDIITEDNWPVVDSAFDRCLDAVNAYREDEGKILYKDVTSRVSLILNLDHELETFEGERIDTVKARIVKAAEDTGVKMDRERFEQEMIFYLEKMDINEEKVRLRQHCKYFMDTIDSEAYPGKKLGFIIQEMGREINTTGSKANHAEIQKCVVRMKDELEKIREQSMNIL